MRYQLIYKEQVIEFDAVFRKRKTLEIQINSLGKINVIIPTGTKTETVMRVVEDKIDWILKKLEPYQDHSSLRCHTYSRGDRFLYQGKEYELMTLLIDENSTPSVCLENDVLCLKTDSTERSRVKLLLEDWYKKEAKALAHTRVLYYEPSLRNLPSKIKISFAKKRWGSCTAKGTVLINWRLIMAPKWVFDYVVVHEMCHLIEMNHSNQFWDLVASVLPDYKKSHNWLKQNGWRLML